MQGLPADAGGSKSYLRILLSLLVLLFCMPCFAQQKFDEALSSIAHDICAASSFQNKKAILCILNFSAPTKEMSDYIQNELITRAVESQKVSVVTRSNLDKIDKEFNYQMSGYVSEETALSICKRLGANAIVFGQLSELENKYNLQVNMLDVETASYLVFKTYTFSRSSKTEQLLGRASSYCRASLGLILEANKNSLSYVAPGAGLYFDYSVFRNISLGAKVIASYDVFEKTNSIYSLEALGLVRVYLVSPSGEPSTGLYLQGEGGADLIFANGNMNVAAEGGISLGFRKEFSSFYIEPCARFGYPYLFGAGLAFGLRL